MKITTQSALEALAQTNSPFIELFKHGTLSVEMYRPEKIDLQQPHNRDEIYVIVAGNGTFDLNGQVTEFGIGDFLFVPAYTPHRFVTFSDDFATWVFFYGVLGGEVG